MIHVYYEVTITLSDGKTQDEWREWMLKEHLPEVMRAGAVTARLIKLDNPPLTYLAQYTFFSRAAFGRYVSEHQPRLRQEALSRFPPPLTTYSRRTGAVL